MLFTVFLYLIGIIVFKTLDEAYYFVTQLFIWLIFLSIGITIFVTEYSLVNADKIVHDVARLVNIDKLKQKFRWRELKTSWLLILPASVFTGLVVDYYIYLTEIKTLSVLVQIYVHVYAHPLLYHYFLVIGFIAGFSGGRAIILAMNYISNTIKIASSDLQMETFRVVRVRNKSRKIKELNELMKIALYVSIGGLFVLAFAAYFILAAAKIVDPLTIAILILGIVVALSFFILPQVLLRDLAMQVKRKLFEDVYTDFGLEPAWFVEKKRKRGEPPPIIDEFTTKKLDEQISILKGLDKHDFHALTSHLEYIENIQEWPIDYKWFIAEFMIALLPFLTLHILPI